MCTVVFLRRPDHRWPVLIAANRDEMSDRPWRPPGRHWPDRPNVTAGQDELAGGSWLGLNDEGVVAGILNRKDSLGRDPELRSRGELVLEALDHADALDAAGAFADLNPRAYRSFNLFVADNRDALWVRSLGPNGPKRVEVRPVPDGLSMLTAWDMDAPASPRTRLYRPRFAAAPPPAPESGDWRAWEELLASRDHDPAALPSEAMFVVTPRGFGTLASSLIALARPGSPKPLKIWRFSDGTAATREWRPVEL